MVSVPDRDLRRGDLSDRKRFAEMLDALTTLDSSSLCVSGTCLVLGKEWCAAYETSPVVFDMEIFSLSFLFTESREN